MKSGDYSAVFAEAMRKLGCTESELLFWAWPHGFANTAGAAGGVGGNMLTGPSPCFGFEDEATGKRIKWCDGVWRIWDGKQEWK